MSLAIRKFPPLATFNRSAPPPSRGDGPVIHSIRPARVPCELHAETPSLHVAWGSRYSVEIDDRCVLLDEDVFLVVNSGHTLRSHFPRGTAGHALGIFFTSDMLSAAFELHGPRATALRMPQLRADIERGLFFEHIRARDRAIASVLRFIAHHLEQGFDEPLWYAEQVAFLLERLLVNEADVARMVSTLTRTRGRTRRELFQRVARVTDLVHSAYESQLTMADLADAAHWSVFHMMRAFKAVHGMSPFEFLQRRRSQTALRLLNTTELPVVEIAERVGFRDRSTLIRRLQRYYGLGPRELRTSNGKRETRRSDYGRTWPVPRTTYL